MGRVATAAVLDICDCNTVEESAAPAPDVQEQPQHHLSSPCRPSRSFMEFTYKGARAAVRGRAFGARRLVEWLMRRACSPFEAWGAWPRSRFAELASNCLKDNQTNAIPAKKLLRLASGRFLCVRTKRIFYLLSFPDVLNANGSRSYYSPLKAGSPAPLHNPLPELGDVCRVFSLREQTGQ